MSREPKPGKITVNVLGTSYEFDVPDTEPEPIRCITPSEYARRTGQSAGSVRGKLRRGTIAGGGHGGSNMGGNNNGEGADNASDMCLYMADHIQLMRFHHPDVEKKDSVSVEKDAVNVVKEPKPELAPPSPDQESRLPKPELRSKPITKQN